MSIEFEIDTKAQAKELKCQTMKISTSIIESLKSEKAEVREMNFLMLNFLKPYGQMKVQLDPMFPEGSLPTTHVDSSPSYL